MRSKKFIFLLLVGVFFLPAQYANAGLDQRCWTKEDCTDQRKGDDTYGNLDATEVANGFVQTPETEKVCGKESSEKEPLGYCLPVAQTQTKIAFGGKQKYLHIGDFIQTLYTYGIIAASILSIIMIMAAGFIWTTSGGNAERIGSAKKKIAGSLMGLLLAGLSYTLLSTLNPALVNLRLPQIWMINQSVLKEATYCIQLEPTDKIASTDEKTGEPNSAYKLPYTLLPPTNAAEKISPKKDGTVEDSTHTSATCGATYAIESSENTCLGNICPKKQFCYDEAGCKKVAPGLQGSIKYSNKDVDDIWLYAICGDDSIEQVSTIDVDDDIQQYTMGDVASEGLKVCKNSIKGYYMTIEVNDSDPGATSDDQWFGGKSFCSNKSGSPSCGLYGETTVNQSDAEDYTLMLWSQQQLFTQAEMENGFVCDLTIEAENMPNIGTSLVADAGVGLVDLFAGEVAAGAVMEFLGGHNKYFANVNFECPPLKAAESEFKEHLKQLISKK